ncbi:hypothetical protein [Mesobacillus subterraneus]|uniref:hypothetical protein n=1 Tax=Mesobacillus subterraneus TaxID=285983 RepID=UPI0014743AE3|nr:hypothetical protein [Mesobacillus subterraneus]
MNAQERPAELNQELFFDVMKRTFEKGTSNNEITIQKLMEDLIIDLKTCSE